MWDNQFPSAWKLQDHLLERRGEASSVQAAMSARPLLKVTTAYGNEHRKVTIVCLCWFLLENAEERKVTKACLESTDPTLTETWTANRATSVASFANPVSYTHISSELEKVRTPRPAVSGEWSQFHPTVAPCMQLTGNARILQILTTTEKF